MADLMKSLKPRQGLIVRDPSTLIPLSTEGASVEWTGPNGRYWRRRLKCGDCTKVKLATKTIIKKRKE